MCSAGSAERRPVGAFTETSCALTFGEHCAVALRIPCSVQRRQEGGQRMLCVEVTGLVIYWVIAWEGHGCGSVWVTHSDLAGCWLLHYR
jgi:hypothetical protein